ncbi:hypothetical protein Daus18300_002617 [Diaporthe australafricana]|uniref:HNH nuclease domain-containing protein n=1 Tax=Diaporthe australafricana TaxID=127596 RepID=A0ABR3XLZ2_9PEZI
MPPTMYELFKGAWQETIRTEVKIPQNLQGAEEAIKGFYAISNNSGRCCAISGLGRYSHDNSALAWSGPGLTILHIIPPQHFEIYPIDTSGVDEKDDELTKKWRMTWHTRENGIALLNHFHALWKARLVAIEPTTLRVRCFGPYNSITAYDGKKAHFSVSTLPNKDALRWHYNMCIHENITAKQAPRPSAVMQDDIVTGAAHLMLLTSSPNKRSLPVAASEALPFAVPAPSAPMTPQEARPHKRPRIDHNGPPFLHLAGTMDPIYDLDAQYCTIKCIIHSRNEVGADPNCPNFNKHRRQDLGAADTAAHKVNVSAVKSRGSARDEDVPKNELGREEIISQYRIISQETVPIMKVVLPHGYTVMGKGVVLAESGSTTTEETQKPALTPQMEADILLKLGPQLAGDCVPFSLGLIGLTKELRDSYYAGPITSALLMASERMPLSEAKVPRKVIREEIRRTVEDIRSHGVTLRHPLKEADLYWNPETQRVVVVNFAGARIR